MPKEQYMCQLCANHGFFNQPKKGHKQKCPYRTCSCDLCALNTKRRALDQIERQLKNAGNPGRKNFDALTLPTSSSAAASTTTSPTPQITPSPSHASPFPFPFTLSDYQREFPTSPTAKTETTTTRVPPTALHAKSPTQHHAFSPNLPFCVALPATIDRKQLKRRRLDLPQDLSSKKSRSLASALQTIARQRSIFHSAEELAS